MTRNLSLRLTIASVLLLTVAGIAQAAPALRPVLATPYSFTSSPVQSTVNVIIDNPNPFVLGGTLTLIAVQPNGVTETVIRSVVIPRGFSTAKVFVPNEIVSVRWARITGVVVL